MGRAGGLYGRRRWSVWTETMVCMNGGVVPEANRSQQGQVCIASSGKVKKLCMEVKAYVSADVFIRALRGSGGLECIDRGHG